ncbi:MAG: lysophospholipid acyltransferase family protein [Planctomycetaceae bacterium]|nr:lysophospholipid acyltransferase family protein [Planctomycetaceae bacterium]
MDWIRLRYWLEYQAFRVAVCLLQFLSPRQTRKLAHAVAALLVDVLPRKWSRYPVAAENIRRAFGSDLPDANVTHMIRGMWVHLVRLVAEVVQVPRKLALTNCRDCIVFRDRDRVVDALLTGRPVMIVGGHFGNWEMTLGSFGMFGFPMGLIAREMDNPYLHRWFVETREAFGHRLYLKKGNFEGITDLMAAGGSLMLLGDQDAGKRGVFVDFFGEPASTFKSIALMAMEYDALLVVGYGIRLPDDDREGRWVRYEIGLEDLIDVRQLTSNDPVREISERYTQALERAIRLAPEQYFWVHRRWKTQPTERQRQAARRAA